MVSIFDDEVEEVGSEIDAFCPKCKADTTHVIISKYEDEIRRVQCNPCGDVHAFRKPRGEMEEEPPEPIAVKKRAAKVKPTWEQMMAKAAKKQPRLYMVAERFGDNELLSHPKFGVGFVSEVIGLDKIEVTFQAEKRVLIHNRQGMSLPPAAYAQVIDVSHLEADKKKGAKGKETSKANGKAAPVAEPPKGAVAKGKELAAKGKDVAAKGAPAEAKGKDAAAAKKGESAKVEAAAKKPAVEAKKGEAAKGSKPAAKKAAPAKKPEAKKAPVKKAAPAKKPAAKKAPAKKPAKKGSKK